MDIGTNNFAMAAAALASGLTQRDQGDEQDATPLSSEDLCAR
jgi:hypothetical protein